MFKRCAIVNTVQWVNDSRIVFCINSSVLWSIAAVASSKINILVLRNNALAKHINWRWPILKFSPPSEHSNNNFFSWLLTNSAKCEFSNANHNCSSE